MRPRHTRQNTLRLESLETRDTMTAGLTAVLADDVLRVTGTEAADDIAISIVQNTLTVSRAGSGEPVHQFPAAAVKRVLVDGRAGDDTIHYQADLPATLVGGAGNDRLFHHGQAAVRPTLLIVVHGFWTSRNYGWDVWDGYALQIRDELEAAGSNTVTWSVDWESLKSADRPEAELERRILAFLEQQNQTWDVLLFGHSRGAVLSANLVNHLDTHARLGNVRAVLLDPTASLLQGDEMPKKISGTAAVDQYDDRYVLSPTVVDGQQIQGADYHDVRAAMKPYVQDHQGTAGWLDAHEQAASAATKAVRWTNQYSEYLPEFQAVSAVLAGAVAAKDAALNHVLITDWYLQSDSWDRDLREFLTAKSAVDHFEVDGSLALERVRLADGSAKVPIGGMLAAFLNTWRWPTDLALSAAQNLVDGAGEIIQETVAGWFPRGSSERANLQTLGGQILSFSDHWFTLARKLTSDLHSPMSRFLVDELGPLVEALVDQNHVAAQGKLVRSLTQRLSGWEMIGRSLAGVLQELPSSRMVQGAVNALPRLTGDALRGFLDPFSIPQLVSVARKLDAAAIQRLLGSLSWNDGLSLLNQLPVAEVAQVVLKFDWNDRLRWLNGMKIERMADVVGQFNAATMAAAFSKMGISRAASGLLEFNWSTRLQVLNQLTPDRVAKVIWEYDWNTMLTALNKMSVRRVADVVWEYDWDRMMNTLNRMSVGRVADVIWEYDWDRMMQTLSRMSVGRVADVIWEYDWDRMLDTLNHMSVSWAAKVVRQYSTSRMWDTLGRMTSSRRTEILRYLGLAPAGVSIGAGPVQATISTSGGSISVGGHSVSW